MAVSRTLLRAAALRGAAPADCLAEVNRLLLRDSPAGLFVTLLYAVLGPRGGLLYASGGHNPPYLLRGGSASALPGRGLPVGVLEEAAYQTFEARLRPGDGLFLYTDGITEARDPAGQLFGDERLRASLHRAGAAGPDELVRAVLEDVQRFAAGAPQADDVTALALRYAGRPEGPP
jgi:serine phosphatase RsbU (regulator of sigma subunit)